MSLRRSSRQIALASITLAAFALHALIPAGFMPASDRPFALELCFEGLPAAVLAHGHPGHGTAGVAASMDMDSMDMGSVDMPGGHLHHHSPGAPAHGEHCVFGSAASTGPAPHLSLPNALPPARALPMPALASSVGTIRLVLLPQPRAPPVRLS